MSTLIQNGTILTGDGKTVIENGSVLVEDGIIREILQQQYPTYSRADTVIDAQGGYVIPGLLNHHSHGITTGPFCPLGAKPLTQARALYNLDRHLVNGVTGLLNLDGLATLSEVRRMNKLHPIKIETATQHTEKNILHAQIGDGEGLTSAHTVPDIAEAIRFGVPAIGEVLAMGPMYNIKRLEAAIGTQVDIQYMPAVKQAVLGERMDPALYDPQALAGALAASGLDRYVSVDEMRDLIIRLIYDPWKAAYDVIQESVELAWKYDVPVIAHNCPETADMLLEVSPKLGNKLIASHSNFCYEPEEAVRVARRLKADGAVIDIATGDLFGPGKMASLDTYVALLEEDLVDLISTDYIAGHWDPILKLLELFIDKGLLTVEKAVALATGNVKKAIPYFANNSGFLEVNRNADIVVVRKDAISDVRYVLIDGVVRVAEGRRVYQQI